MVDNQHQKIKGYRDLSEQEILMMNQVKEHANAIEALIEELRTVPNIDQRWLNTGTTDLQKGFMCVVRSIARPTTF